MTVTARVCRSTTIAMLVSVVGALPSLADSPRPDLTNLAKGLPVAFGSAPNYPAVTDAADPGQLTDGSLSTASPMWYDTQAVGWRMVDPVVFTLDLGRDAPIRGVAMHTCGGKAGVEWPAGIYVYVSDTGDRYSLVGDLMSLSSEKPPARGYADQWLVTDAVATHGRYVRFVCSPNNLGNGAYVFLDEVEVYEGDDAWLARPLAFAEAPTHWRAEWSEITWSPRPEAVRVAARPTPLTTIDGDRPVDDGGPLYHVATAADGVTFTLKGEAGRPREMRWSARLAEPVSTERCRWVTLRFRGDGLRRSFRIQPLVQLEGVNHRSDENSVVLLEVNAALNDGRYHTLLKRLPDAFDLHRVAVTIETDSDSASLEIAALELSDVPPQVFTTQITADTARMPDGFIPVALGDRLDGTLAEWFAQSLEAHGAVLDGATGLAPGPVVVSGVPFVIADGPANLARLPQSELPEDEVLFLGAPVKRRHLNPPSRDDSLSVDVDAAAREVALLIALSAPPVQRRGGIPHAPLKLRDIECIAIELMYDGDETEVSFPYSVADEACYLPARELGAYIVAADPSRRLRRVTLRSNQYGIGLALAGVTLNTSGQAMVPSLAAVRQPETVRENPDPPARPPRIDHSGHHLTFSNRWYLYRLDLSEGFVIDRMVNRWNDGARIGLAPDAGLRVRVGETIYTGRCFTPEITELTPTRATIRLSSRRAELPLTLLVRMTTDDSAELAFDVELTHHGKDALAVETCLPALRGFAIDQIAPTRLFFPQYRAVDTDQHVALRAPYGVEFSGQFMDIYNRAAGVGLMVRTDNPQQDMATFTLRKDDRGVSGGVCFPAEHNTLAAGERRAYPRVSLIAHNGDWHTAFRLYRDWLRRWYSPYKSQNKEVFLKAWDLTCYRPSVDISWSDGHIPPPLSADRSRWFIDEIFAFETEHLGHVPDLVHFFNWTHNDRLHRNEYGAVGTDLAYDQVGGLEVFRSGIARIQDHWKRPLSLYTLPDRFRLSALPDQALAAALAAAARHKVIDDDASAALRGAGQPDGIVFPQIGDERWVEYAVKDIAQMQSDTGCTCVYLDVFPYFSHLPCQDGSTTLSASLHMAKAMREALPDDVVFWSEYALTDVASQFADGCHHYYFLDLNETFARPYNRTDRAPDVFMDMPMTLQRFTLPRYRLVDLPAYIEAGNCPSQIDAAFVNAEMFTENTYRIHPSRMRAKINRGDAVKRRYPDCFRTDTPAPRVPTAAEGLVANHFPGDGRDAWTIYNGRPRTYSGVVLSVPHRTGATYRDAWNDRDLAPVIADGMAHLAVTLHPQQPGCVVQQQPR
ncbi:MAG: hypothetical protein GX595_20585 [Lentisphaerae bacterium]|nr:hypothetical protein [Lentisphaerota bacterium]